MYKLFILTLAVLNFNLSSLAAQNTVIEKSKIVIAHRGASGYLPEHTLAAKAMSYAMRPDFIEQDLVLSKDNIPIVIHDVFLDDVTNVAEVFPEKSRENGRFYVIDFTYDELQQLEVYERFNTKTKKAVYPGRFPFKKSRFKLHSLQEEIELIQGLNKSTGNNIGIYPEIKNPNFHLKNGKDISIIVLKILNDYGYRSKSDHCILQCFDHNELERIRVKLKSELYLTQLIEFPSEIKNIGQIARYANAIGPSINQVFTKDKTGKITYSALVKKAHNIGLKVHAYTFRKDVLGNFKTFEEMLQQGFINADLDGVFTDFPDIVISYVNAKP